MNKPLPRDFYARDPVTVARELLGLILVRQLPDQSLQYHAIVEVGSAEIFNYPFLFMTGHGNVVFSDQEAENLRNYLLGGGFLLIDDDFGMSDFVHPAMKKVFPEYNFVELPAAHPIFFEPFNFPKGLPKIHKHNDKSPEAMALPVEEIIG